MYVDNQLVLDSALAIANNSTAEVSTNVYDNGLLPDGSTVKRPDIGSGVPLYMVAVLTNISGTYAAPDQTLEVQFISATATNLTTGQVIHGSIGTFAASAVEGTMLVGALPSTFGQGTEMQRYWGARYVKGGSIGTACAIDVFVTNTPQTYKAYPKVYTIS
jgi:hypothetical protein